MFKIAVTPSYWETVSVAVPTDTSKTDIRKFEVQYKRLSQTELDSLRGRIVAGDITDRQLVEQVVLSWKGVQDESGAELEFNPQNLGLLLEVFPTQPSIIKTFFKTVEGARAKN